MKYVLVKGKPSKHSQWRSRSTVSDKLWFWEFLHTDDWSV